MFKRYREFVRIGITFLLLAAACAGLYGLFIHYMYAPWTRDGRVRVQVVNSAPEVSGTIVGIHVTDNQSVKIGDLLYEIDPAEYEIAVAGAQAELASRQADMAVKVSEAERRAALTTLSASIEEKQQYSGAAAAARAAVNAAQARLDRANLDLEHTKLHSTVNGYVTNLLMRLGDFASTGRTNISIVDSDSFWVDGYFEETKLGNLKLNDKVYIQLMGYTALLTGHIESFTRGISTINATPGTQGLPNVDPIYTWVRLAQRIPVRIHIDDIPEGVPLAAGMTCTVWVKQEPLWQRIVAWFRRH
ncbi:biotin/lipoyl-binding protein [Beijerinckia indica]|uniref:Secretion protein HlyD family protein n=1 Tax=Beijerinckia indica subsp. indica (strain ATCC 9039 / DSM 1715 / NCIMB 8712) TaxID=395963 RepID=B2IKA9_BEII9|nr:HlyD family secretion protein [Beijerinckia indica]ACB95039.1 secretion protein HlyD family protein [Beijerinckia indica subsp. indica ATCC 9039]